MGIEIYGLTMLYNSLILLYYQDPETPCLLVARNTDSILYGVRIT